MALTVEQVDTSTAPESVLEEMWHYYREVFAELLPDDPPESLARVVADWRVVRPEAETLRWLLRNNGAIEAVAVVHIDLVDNLDNGFGRIHVTAPRRGNGHARLLATPLFDWLESKGRTRIHTNVVEGGQFDGLLTRLGLKEAYHDQRSRLLLADVDRDLMGRWVEQAAERATDYELLVLNPPMPEEHLQKYCDILFQMNTAPREDFEEEDETMTPERWREVEETNRESRYHLHTLVAVHQPTGVFAGSTSVAADLLDPLQGWQWETVVHPEHRERGLGRWLKAAMIDVVEREHPEMVRIDTENSTTNDAMLGINLTMGFKPIGRQVIWQGDLATARSNWGV